MSLNKEQQLAVDSNERTILCLAAAGSGKTKTLLARIERLVNEGVDPKSILALTFTNAAAFEMKERYKKIPNIDLSRGTPEFRTFHSFCYSLIIKDIAVRTRLGYSEIPQICDDNKMKEIRTKVKLQINCDLSDAKLENDVALSRKEQAMKDLFKKALIKEIKKENVITFDIMCYNVCELFSTNEECIQKYKSFYKHLLCDEFQDTDPKQFKFISSFPETTNFFLVGDVLQCIYQFRNCSNEFIKQLTNAPGWQIIKLYQNYRSTTNICEFTNKFSTYSKDEYRIEMNGQRSGEDVEVIYGSNSSYTHPVDEDHLDMLIERLKNRPVESAILCRTNKECACVREALKEADIEFCSNNKTTDTVDLLNGALDNEYLIGWLASMLDSTDYGDYIRLSAQIENPTINWFFGLYGNKEKIKNAGNKIKKIRTIASGPETTFEKFNKITSYLKIKSKCEIDEDTKLSNRELIENIRDQIVEYEESKIYVGTIHSSKGLEYEAVYVMGVNDSMFRLGEEDMNNLFYVAMTRAKNHLTIFRR